MKSFNFLKCFLLINMLILFTACGGGGGSSSSTPVVNGTTTDTTTDTISPQFTLENKTIEENQKYVLTVKATDVNPITYSLSGEDENSLEIGKNSGELTFKNAPDYEKESERSFKLSIIATDSSNNSLSKKLTITISNIIDVKPILGTTIITVENNITAGTLLSQDLNIITAGEAAISSIKLSGDIADKFSVSNNGKLTLNLNAALNSLIGRHTLSAIAVSAAGESQSKSFFLDVIDVSIPNQNINNPIPSTIVFKAVKKTGQVLSYDNNGNEVGDDSLKDDGFYQKGVATNYSRDTTTETVTDDITGLIWQDNASVTLPWLSSDNNSSCDNNLSNPECLDTTGDTATTYCTNLSLGGYENWRLPTSIELQKIINYAPVDSKSIENIFENTESAYYWSSTSVQDFAGNAWRVDFKDAYVTGGDKGSSNYVRCVHN